MAELGGSPAEVRTSAAFRGNGAADAPARTLPAETRFVDICFVEGPSGRKSYIRGGLDVWEYVFTAQAYDWNVAATADHLSEPAERVVLALEYYRQHPDEIDARLERMRKAESDPEVYLPRARRLAL